MTDDQSTLDKQHKEAMAQIQAHHRTKLKQKRAAEHGLILVHTGHGKGKSTSAFGVIARALGWGQKVAVVQFIKGDWKTGEKEFFSRFEDQLDWFTMGEGFTWDVQDRQKDIAAATQGWERAKEVMTSGDYKLVVLDELNIALLMDYLPIDEVIAGLKAHHSETSVVITGRDAPDEIIEIADTATEMRQIKHAFDAGIKAVPGLDY